MRHPVRLVLANHLSHTINPSNTASSVVVISRVRRPKRHFHCRIQGTRARVRVVKASDQYGTQISHSVGSIVTNAKLGDVILKLASSRSYSSAGVAIHFHFCARANGDGARYEPVC